MTAQQERKRHIRAFMQAHYTDERLSQLLAHAQDGKLAYHSCCCFIGVATADHPLALGYEYANLSTGVPHYRAAHDLPGSLLAEVSYKELGAFHHSSYWSTEESRRRILIPMIRAEMKRRERLKEPTCVDTETAQAPAEMKKELIGAA